MVILLDTSMSDEPRDDPLRSTIQAEELPQTRGVSIVGIALEVAAGMLLRFTRLTGKPQRLDAEHGRLAVEHAGLTFFVVASERRERCHRAATAQRDARLVDAGHLVRERACL